MDDVDFAYEALKSKILIREYLTGVQLEVLQIPRVASGREQTHFFGAAGKSPLWANPRNRP